MLVDFHDFVSCVINKGEALILNYSDILLFENCVNQGKFTNKPLLESVECVKFIKGETALYWKPSMNDNEFLLGDFLKKKVVVKISKGLRLKNMKSPRGVPETKKIISLPNYAR